VLPGQEASRFAPIELGCERDFQFVRAPFFNCALLATRAPLVDYFNPGVFDHARSNHGCLKPPLRSIGNLLSTIGRLPEAEAEMHAALAITQKLADDEPDDTAFRRGLAASDYAPGLAVCLDGKIG
jgi:hypothetical protein